MQGEFTHKEVMAIFPNLKVRTLISWSERGLLTPALNPKGRGNRKIYSFDDLLHIYVISRLKDDLRATDATIKAMNLKARIKKNKGPNYPFVRYQITAQNALFTVLDRIDLALGRGTLCQAGKLERNRKN